MFSEILTNIFKGKKSLAEGGFNPQKKRNFVDIVIQDKDGNIKHKQRTYNLRTNVGIDFVADALSFSPQPAPANYIAVSTDAGAPLVGDTVLASEVVGNGLTRALGTYAHTSFATSFTVEKVFSVTGGPQTINKAALFNAAAGGVLVFEALLSSSATVTTSDTLTISWTINL